MKITSSSQQKATLLRTNLVLGFGLALTAAFAFGGSTPAQAAPRSKMYMRSGRVTMAQAGRIARNYVGRGAQVVRNEGVHGGMYRIHVHHRGVARHVYVGARTGRVIKTHVISRSADRREDGR